MKILNSWCSIFVIIFQYENYALADTCQTATLEQDFNINIPCVAVNDQLSRFRLEPINTKALGPEVPQGIYWQSSGFEDSDCQPNSSVCATLDKYSNLRLPIKIGTLNAIAHLEHYYISSLKKDYWRYRYHYQVAADFDLKSRTLTNEAAYIAPQCYTKTVDTQGRVHNPCFSCHQKSLSPNYNNDDDLQTTYAFPDYALTNHWTNLFKDRSQLVAAISDETILAYIRTNNYQNVAGQFILTKTLQQVPAAWDYNNNGQWDGFMPDCYFNFDAEGFDRTPSGDDTGWRAFAYYPFLGTFWPTNGSTDDVLIRLPIAFRQNESGEWDRLVYKINLAIVEALIKQQDVAISPVAEPQYGVDLDKDGQLATAHKIVYDWAPLQGRQMSYIGRAKLEVAAGKQYLAAGLFPLGTEFLHSVRYLDVDNAGQIKLAARMKELRYARKAAWRTYSQLQDLALHDIKEAHDFPDRLELVIGNMERGVSNRQGWILQGFIEDAQGQLRPQTYEEHVFCIGCHTAIGATTDSTFAFARKLSSHSEQQGWYHWSQKSLKDLPEPRRSDGRYEYTFYLENNRAGDEFRANQEVIKRFFNNDSSLKPAMITTLHDDISMLLWPSTSRALQLNKVYWIIVQEQSFKEGRDSTITPPEYVHQTIENTKSTAIETLLTGSLPLN